MKRSILIFYTYVHNVYVHLYFLKLDFDDMTIFLNTKGDGGQ